MTGPPIWLTRNPNLAVPVAFSPTGPLCASRLVVHDTVRGGGGNDLVQGGDGSDVHQGGSGNDTLRSSDGARDVVNCGPGVDRASVDELDQVKDCEKVTVVVE